MTRRRRRQAALARYSAANLRALPACERCGTADRSAVPVLADGLTVRVCRHCRKAKWDADERTRAAIAARTEEARVAAFREANGFNPRDPEDLSDFLGRQGQPDRVPETSGGRPCR